MSSKVLETLSDCQGEVISRVKLSFLCKKAVIRNVIVNIADSNNIIYSVKASTIGSKVGEIRNICFCYSTAKNNFQD